MENTGFSCNNQAAFAPFEEEPFPTLNSYDSSIMTSSLEFSPSTGFPISAMRLASSSSDVSFLSGTSERRGREGAEMKTEITVRLQHAQLISMLY